MLPGLLTRPQESRVLCSRGTGMPAAYEAESGNILRSRFPFGADTPGDDPYPWHGSCRASTPAWHTRWLVASKPPQYLSTARRIAAHASFVLNSIDRGSEVSPGGLPPESSPSGHSCLPFRGCTVPPDHGPFAAGLGPPL